MDYMSSSEMAAVRFAPRLMSLRLAVGLRRRGKDCVHVDAKRPG